MSVWMLLFYDCYLWNNWLHVWAHYVTYLDSLRWPRPLLWSYSDTPHSVGLLWTSDRPVAETSTCQHTTLTRQKYPCPQRDSNPQTQQVSGRRPTPSIARPLGWAVLIRIEKKLAKQRIWQCKRYQVSSKSVELFQREHVDDRIDENTDTSHRIWHFFT